MVAVGCGDRRRCAGQRRPRPTVRKGGPRASDEALGHPYRREPRRDRRADGGHEGDFVGSRRRLVVGRRRLSAVGPLCRDLFDGLHGRSDLGLGPVLIPT